MFIDFKNKKNVKYSKEYNMEKANKKMDELVDKQIYRLMTPKIIEQDTNKIKEIISKVGMFQWEETEKYLRIIGYR